METEAIIRRQGNSVGVILPQPILRAMGLAVGQTVSLQTTPNGLIIKPKQKRYTAAELNALCDPNAAMPADLLEWENMRPAGTESI